MLRTKDAREDESYERQVVQIWEGTTAPPEVKHQHVNGWYAQLISCRTAVVWVRSEGEGTMERTLAALSDSPCLLLLMSLGPLSSTLPVFGSVVSSFQCFVSF